MPNELLLIGFVAAALVVLLIPGPGVLYVVGRSIGQGYRVGLASALGLAIGAFVHVAAATVGLSAILLTSSIAFSFVKILGALYLIYLGVMILVSRSHSITPNLQPPLSLYRAMADGVIVSVLNPKIAVFFLAFLPQFIDPAGAPVNQQVLLLGLIYIALALVTDSFYALMAGSLRRWLGSRVMQGPVPKYVSGGLYVGLGIKAAVD